MPAKPVRKFSNVDFNPSTYVDTYYPPIVQIERLFKTAKLIEQRFKKWPRVNLKTLKGLSGISEETIENLAIFNFQRLATIFLLKKFPKGHIDILDIGGGPTIYQHIALSLAAYSITHSEFLLRNRQAVQSWVNGNTTANDWTGYFELMQKMLLADKEFNTLIKKELASKEEGAHNHAKMVHSIVTAKSSDSFIEHTRNTLRGHITYADIFTPGLSLKKKGPFCVVTTNFVAESATSTIDEWKKGMTNAANLLPKGGIFIHTAIKNAEWYSVGEERFPAVKIDEKRLRSFCKEQHIKIHTLRTLDGCDSARNGYRGMLFLIGEKQKEN